MGERTDIQWTDATWGPVRGCSVASPGCEHCYAAGIAARFSGPDLPFEGFAKRSAKRGLPQWTGRVELVYEHLADPLRWRKGRRIFVSSMSDVFHEGLPNESIAAIFAVMAACPRHTFQVLTKRAERMRDWFEWFRGETVREADPANDRANECLARHLAGYAQSELGDGSCADEERQFWRVHDAILKAGSTWPLPNVHLGVSVEDQRRADERIPFLLDTPAEIRFLSVEPQLEPIDLRRWIERGSYCDGCDALIDDGNTDNCECGNVTWEYWGDDQLYQLREGPADDPLPIGSDIHWIVQGGESGPHARPFHIDWAQSLRRQCEQAGVAYFLKQLGARPTTDALAAEDPGAWLDVYKDRAGADPSEWPVELRVQQFPGVRS